MNLPKILFYLVAAYLLVCVSIGAVQGVIEVIRENSQKQKEPKKPKKQMRAPRPRARRKAFGLFSKCSSPAEMEDWVSSCQKGISCLLYLSVIAHGIEVFLTDVNVLMGIVPALRVISALSALAFFVAECVIMPPLGLLIMTAVAVALFYAIPYIVAFIAGVTVSSLFLLVVGGFIAVLSMGLVIFVVDGVIVGAVVTPMIVAPFLLGFGATMATGVAGTAAAAAVHEGVKKISPGEMIRPWKALINLVMLFLLIWPALTWFDVCPGIFALKPVMRAQQQHRSFSGQYASTEYEYFFTGEGNDNIAGERRFSFRQHFYEKYIYPGSNTFAQGATPSASRLNHIAFCLNGVIYLTDTENNNVYHATAYALEPEDSIVMVGLEAFVFCRDRLLLLGPEGRYLHKDTKWTSEFEDLSPEEQYEKLYSILEKQNTDSSVGFGIEDVAVVAYAQRNGLLLYYNYETHSAYFARKDKDGQITILRQSAPDSRTEAAVFTPSCRSDNLPYTMINSTVVAYINEDQIIFQGVDEDWQTVHYTNKTHDGKTHPFISFHVIHDEDGKEYFAYQDSQDMICLELLGSPVKEAFFDASRYDGVYSVGSYVYAIAYDSGDLINRVTYAHDVTNDESVTSVWTENWSWDRIRLEPELWGIHKETEPTIPWEELPFDVRYAEPELSTSVRQVGLYKDNVATPGRFASWHGPVDGFRFRYPRVLYDMVDYTWSEDETEVCVRLYCSSDPSSLTVTLRPNTQGIDHQTLLPELLAAAKDAMVNEKTKRSGLDNEEGTASSFYLRGYAADNENLICTRLCRVDNEYIMEMELRVPRPTGDEDEIYKEFYIMVMEAICGFGSGDAYTGFWKFKHTYQP